MTEIRLARAEEAEAIHALVRDAYALYVPRIGREPAPMNDDYAELIAAGKVWVIDDEGKLAGVVVLEDTSDALQVENVAVRPESQGQGFGRQLLSFGDDEARRRGYGAVILYTNVNMTENLERYPKLGYVEVGRGHEHGFDRVFFEKRLPQPGGQTIGRGIVGLGLGGEENLYPPEPFAPVFSAAKRSGLASVPHAGEVVGAASVRGALEALADRIRHGIHAVEDPGLVREIAGRQFVLDVCPISNLRTGPVRSLAEHPLPQLVAAGVRCSISTDDPQMFDTDLSRDYEAATSLGLWSSRRRYPPPAPRRPSP